MANDRDNTTRPSHLVYSVREGKHEDESYWDRCGVAFEHRDRQGFNLQLSTLPIDGRLTMRTPFERQEGDDEERSRGRTRQRRRDR